MGSDLVGRDEELAAITHLLLRVAAGGSGCCLIEGAVGIGKTALWNAALELAGQRGFLVLKAHPVEAETAYSFAAVADLLRPVLDEVLKGLPAPQKVALETALLIDGGNDRAPDPHAVSMAALTALELLAKKRPVVVAVDDAQWLDSPSRMTLQFVARRLTARMALLMTERTEGHGEPTTQLAGERLTPRPLLPFCGWRRPPLNGEPSTGSSPTLSGMRRRPRGTLHSRRPGPTRSSRPASSGRRLELADAGLRLRRRS